MQPVHQPDKGHIKCEYHDRIPDGNQGRGEWCAGGQVAAQPGRHAQDRNQQAETAADVPCPQADTRQIKHRERQLVAGRVVHQADAKSEPQTDRHPLPRCWTVTDCKNAAHGKGWCPKSPAPFNLILSVQAAKRALRASGILGDPILPWVITRHVEFYPTKHVRFCRTKN